MSNIKAEFSDYLSLSWLERYNIYLNSREWQRRRQGILERDSFICQSCLGKKATEVHHLTYTRVGCELATDLISLCSSCHRAVTTMHRASKVRSSSGIHPTNFAELESIVYGALSSYMEGNYTYEELMNIYRSSFEKPFFSFSDDNYPAEILLKAHFGS